MTGGMRLSTYPHINIKIMLPDKDGYFGIFGGRYVPENLVEPLEKLEEVYNDLKLDEDFKKKLNTYMRDYIHRPTPLYYAERLSRYFDLKIYIKREDLIPSGSYKMNSAIGQVFLAKHLDKRSVIAYTESGQNAISVATAARLFDLPCKIFIRERDYAKLGSKLARLRLMDCVLVKTGEENILDVSMNAWLGKSDTDYLIIDSIIGPHPYPRIVRDFQSAVGKEARKQIIERTGKLPDIVISSMKYGTNAIGLFYPFIDDNCKLMAVLNSVYLMDSGLDLKVAVRYGAKCYEAVNSDNVVFGPEISFYIDNSRVSLGTINKDQVHEAYRLFVKKEAIFTSLSSITSIAYLTKIVDKIQKGSIILINIVGFLNSNDIEGVEYG